MSSEKTSYFEDGKILLFDKPVYWTSFDLVNKVRIMIRANLGIKKIKVGHAGTLDPLASGLMILCTGKATKRIDEFINSDKEYIATIHLGASTLSYDLETEINKEYSIDHITLDLVLTTLNSFIGEQNQMPPLYSAKFIDGKRAYEYARKGVEKELQPVKICFREIELTDFSLPEIKVRILCSKGTYIRSFARDLGEALGSGAYLSSLVRSSIGEFKLESAINLEKFQIFLEQMKQS
jgi:tRNA pseudouridine55 synthase